MTTEIYDLDKKKKSTRITAFLKVTFNEFMKDARKAERTTQNTQYVTGGLAPQPIILKFDD